MPRSQPDERPWTDEIVAEVRLAREQLFAVCDYDLKKFAERLRAAQEASGRVAVTYPRRKPSKPVPAWQPPNQPLNRTTRKRHFLVPVALRRPAAG